MTGILPQSKLDLFRVAILISILALTSQAIAQSPPRYGGRPRDIAATPESVSTSIKERQLMMEQIERDNARGRGRESEEQEKLAWRQIADDFNCIQVVNNRMMSLTIPAATPDYGIVIDTTMEIRKRAVRLKDNLRLPRIEASAAGSKREHKRAVDFKTMKEALLVLDGVIMKFVKSPIFQNTGVVNVEKAEAAGSSLDTIIEFSKLIRKDAEKLGKK